jgi:carnitine O-palmitoyltransferase 2
MYMRGRWSLPLNSNPGSYYNSSAFAKSADWPSSKGAPSSLQVRRAAQCIRASLDFLRLIENETLAPDEFKGNPLDMFPYTVMFGSTRAPMLFRDVTVRSPSSRHVTVLRGGEFFKVEVMDAKRNPYSAATIAKSLEQVVNNRESSDVIGLAALTTLDRDAWATAYADLTKTSHEALGGVGGALFHVCLDDEEDTPSSDEKNNIVRSSLHGTGRNRWFDQSFTLVVDSKGRVGSNFEHSWGDGLSIVRWANVVFDRISRWTAKDFGEETSLGKAAVQKIRFGRVSKDVLAARDKALDAFQASCKALKLETRAFNKFGVEETKRLRASADAVFQQAVQLAFRRMTGKTEATYESCSTQTFLGGRTETIRSASPDSVRFVAEMTDCLSEGDVVRAKLLRKALERHAQLAAEAASGKGFDRHLFCLKKLAESKKLPLPDLLKGPGYALLEKNVISTSTVSHGYVDQAAFGPVVANGIGICYHFFPDRIHFCVTSYELDPKEFSNRLEGALMDIHGLLQIPLT